MVETQRARRRADTRTRHPAAPVAPVQDPAVRAPWPMGRRALKREPTETVVRLPARALTATLVIASTRTRREGAKHVGGHLMWPGVSYSGFPRDRAATPAQGPSADNLSIRSPEAPAAMRN